MVGFRQDVGNGSLAGEGSSNQRGDVGGAGVELGYRGHRDARCVHELDERVPFATLENFLRVEATARNGATYFEVATHTLWVTIAPSLRIVVLALHTSTSAGTSAARAMNGTRQKAMAAMVARRVFMCAGLR